MLSVGPIPQHSRPLCGMIIGVKCHKQYFGKRFGACCCEQKYADLQFVPDDQTGVQFIFALSFLLFRALVFSISFSVIINCSPYMKLILVCVV